MYLTTCTWPDLAVAASLLVLKLHNKTSVHVLSAKRELRYLRRTLECELKIKPDAKTQPTA